MSNHLEEYILKSELRPWKFIFQNKYIVRKFCTKINVTNMPGKKTMFSNKTLKSLPFLKLGVLYDRLIKLYNFYEDAEDFEFYVYMNNLILNEKIRILKNHKTKLINISHKVFCIYKSNIVLCSVNSVNEYMISQAMLSHLYYSHFGERLYDQFYDHLFGHLLKQHLNFNLKRKNPIKKGVIR